MLRGQVLESPARIFTRIVASQRFDQVRRDAPRNHRDGFVGLARIDDAGIATASVAVARPYIRRCGPLAADRYRACRVGQLTCAGKLISGNPWSTALSRTGFAAAMCMSKISRYGAAPAA